MTSVSSPRLRSLLTIFKKMRKGKAAGLDDVSIDLVKTDPKGIARLLHPLIVKTMLTGKQPWSWRGGFSTRVMEGQALAGNM